MFWPSLALSHVLIVYSNTWGPFPGENLATYGISLPLGFYMCSTPTPYPLGFVPTVFGACS